jgi:ABC-2 type transport system ATP-binding protein
MVVLAVDELVQGYRDVAVLHGVSASFGVGVHGLLGPNGAGKTTLLQTIAGLRRPRSGYVSVDDQDIVAGKGLAWARRHVSFLPQNFEYPPGFTPADLVAYGLWTRRVTGPHGSMVDKALRSLGLEDQARRRLKHLSGGTLQRAGIAQAVAGSPEVVLLDEPTVGLDPEQRLALRDLLRELGKATCIVLSTHIVDDVGHLCERVAVLVDGRIRYDGGVAGLAGRAGSAVGMSGLESGYLVVAREANQS